MEFLSRLSEEVHTRAGLARFEEHPQLLRASKRLQINSRELIHYAIRSAFVLFGMSLMVFSFNFVYFFFAVLYPAYMSFKALSSEDSFSKDGRFYGQYWVSYVILKMFLKTFGFILFAIPFFKVALTLFTIALYSRKTRGAEFTFELIVRPFLNAFGGSADYIFGRIKNFGGEHIPEGQTNKSD